MINTKKLLNTHFAIPDVINTVSENYWKMVPPLTVDETYSIIKNESSGRYILYRCRVKRIHKNGPVTVVLWEDGEKTIVRRDKNTPDDPYAAFCAALAKHMYGNNSRVKKLIEEKTVVPKEKKKKNDAKDFLAKYREMREKGMKQTEIAETLDIPLSALRSKVATYTKRKKDQKDE